MEGKIHLGIIPDGNRRWAKGKGLLPWNGHEKAIENFEAILQWCKDSNKVGVLTLWCFSTENWKRDKKEVQELMRIYEEYLQKQRQKFADEKIAVVHSGRKDRIPSSLAKLIAQVEFDAPLTPSMILNLAIDYGGKDEIIRAMRKMEEPSEVHEDALRNHLDHPELPDFDVIIRTSGEQRTSNFFLWQSTYAEWFFIEKYFPELTPQDVEECIYAFEKRDRRFGK